jgi:hypothetical protein
LIVIKYRLQCESAHEFEVWFASSARYEAQIRSHDIACPQCGSTDVEKAIMAPNVPRRAFAPEPANAVPELQSRHLALLRQVRNVLAAGSEDVGTRFADEARKIHYGETDLRSIRGEATSSQARELIEEGIEVMILPSLPEEAN